MVGRVGLFWASCPPPLRGRFRYATTFKFAPGELVEPTTIGLKVQNGKYNGLYINELPGRPMHRFAVLRWFRLSGRTQTGRGAINLANHRETHPQNWRSHNQTHHT